MQEANRIVIRHDGEWGEFFFSASGPIALEGGDTRFAATWCCVSSFGVYGHHWGYMGEAFAEFVRDLEEDYLLSKISTRETSGEVACNDVRRQILESRKKRAITKDEARDAMDAVNSVEADGGSGESMCDTLLESSELECVGIDWCGLNCREWNNQALQFVRKLWPMFVAELQKELEPTR